MIRFKTIADLKNSELLEGDLVEIFGEFQEGDGPIMIGKVVPADKFTVNRREQLANGAIVEIFPSGRTVTETYVDTSINHFHTDDAIPYATGILISRMTDKISRDNELYVPKYIPLTLTTWDQDVDKLLKLPKVIAEENLSELVHQEIIDKHLYAQTKQEFDAIRILRKRRYAASGTVRNGESVIAEEVNKGLNGSTTESNTIIFGTDSIQSVEGNLCYLDGKVLLPEAPDGTKVYDKATNTVIDYTTYTDPKYGNVAGSYSEAVIRAHEGVIKNSDFRLGNSDWGIEGTVTFDSNGANLTTTGEFNAIYQTGTLEFNTTYHISVNVSAVTGTYQMFLYYGNGEGDSSKVQLVPTVNNTNITEPGTHDFIFTTRAADSAPIRIFIARSGSGNQSCTITSIKQEAPVITSTRDLVILNSFYESITDSDYVNPKGNVQFSDASWNGITLTNSYKEQAYSRFHEEDTITKGYGLRWSTASNAERIKFMQDPSNNIYYDEADDKYYQAKYKKEVIIGIDNEQEYSEILLRNGFTKSQEANEPLLWEKGSSKYLPLCSVQRLNKGAFFPDHNPFGCAQRDQNKLYFKSTTFPKTPVECFLTTYGGNIMSGLTGRVDLYSYYDAISEGQIEDLRVCACKQEYVRELDEGVTKAIEGKLRGKSKLPFTRVFPTEALARAAGYDYGQMDTVTNQYVAFKWLDAQFNYLPWVDIAASPDYFKLAYPNGALGMWLGIHPTGQTMQVKVNKRVEAKIKWIVSVTNGTAWYSGETTVIPATNVFTVSLVVHNIGMWYYDTLTDFTKAEAYQAPVIPSNRVIESSRYETTKGNRLIQSVLGYPATDTINTVTESSIGILNDSKATYTNTEFVAPANESVSLVTFPALINKGGLLYIQFNSKEKKYTSSSWGTGLDIPIVSNESTQSDSNGQTVKVNCHHTLLPIGISY